MRLGDAAARLAAGDGARLDGGRLIPGYAQPLGRRAEAAFEHQFNGVRLEQGGEATAPVSPGHGNEQDAVLRALGPRHVRHHLGPAPVQVQIAPLPAPGVMPLRGPSALGAGQRAAVRHLNHDEAFGVTSRRPRANHPPRLPHPHQTTQPILGHAPVRHALSTGMPIQATGDSLTEFHTKPGRPRKKEGLALWGFCAFLLTGAVLWGLTGV